MENSKLKSFEIVEKEKQNGTGVYYQLNVKTLKDKEAFMFLSESQKAVIDEVGIEKCRVDIEERKSGKTGNSYKVIALHIADIETFDFFPKDRAFITLAELHARKSD